MRGYPTPIKPMKRIQRNEKIIAEIGEENYNYILNHHGKQKRHIIAKKTGILKFNLNQYYITLFPQEAM